MPFLITTSSSSALFSPAGTVSPTSSLPILSKLATVSSFLESSGAAVEPTPTSSPSPTPAFSSAPFLTSSPSPSQKLVIFSYLSIYRNVNFFLVFQTFLWFTCLTAISYSQANDAVSELSSLNITGNNSLQVCGFTNDIKTSSF